MPTLSNESEDQRYSPNSEQLILYITRMSGRHTSSAPIPIPNNGEPTELHRLISLKNHWTAVIERCTTYPHEVGSSLNLRNDKGYTALHTVTAYNHATHGDVLVPVIRAILSAADEIDYACAYTLGSEEDEDMNENTVNTNEIIEGQDISTTAIQQQREQASRGSWRLLLDNNNRAQWTPIHLICVQGGIVHGKVAVLRALLQMDVANTCEEEQEEAIQYQKQIICSLDRQNRNVLHHLLVGVVPSDEAFDAFRFIVDMVPSLLFQQDKFEKTPLQYVLNRIMENPSSRRSHYMNSYGGDNEGMAKNYKMLKLLVRLMEEETNTWSEEEMRLGAKQSCALRGDSTTDTSSFDVDAASVQDNETTSTSISNGRKNVLHSACRLPGSVCPSDGSLIRYLCSEHTWKLEEFDRLVGLTSTHGRPMFCFPTEKDDNGDLPLHLFLSNKTYTCGGSRSVSVASPSNVDDVAAVATERGLIKALLHDPDKTDGLVSTPNINNELPLHLAMRAGRRQAVGILVIEYYQAVLLDDDLDNNWLFVHVLSCISMPRRLCSSEPTTTELHDTEKKCLGIMFELVRARPDIVSVGGTNGPRVEEEGKKNSKWWKKIFS